MSKYARFYAILKQINQSGGSRTKEDIVLEFTNGRTTSLSNLQPHELGALERHMVALSTSGRPALLEKNSRSTAPTQKEARQQDKMRKAIISQFRSIGKSANNAKEWAEKYGCRGAKRRFNDYSTEELIILIRNAEKMKSDHIRSIAKKLK